MFAAASASAAPQPHAAPAVNLVRTGGPAIHVTTPRTAARGGLLNAATSTNWSGYAANGGTYTTVTSSWVEPTGTCTSRRSALYSSFWVGLDGFSSGTVEQTGTDVDCSGRTPVYYGWYEFFPNPSFVYNDAVSPGDHFTATASFTGGSSFAVTLSDTTKHWSHTTTGSVPGAARSSAEAIIEAPCCTASGGILPLADFGTANFTSTTVDGSAIGNFSPTEIIMVNNSGTPKDSITALSGGTSFSGTWLRSN
jgi:hypothetical protein